MDYPISDVPLSIDTNPAQAAPTISLDTRTPTTPIDPEDARKRAFRASFALNDAGIDPNYVFEEVQKGNEDSIRDEAAAKLNADIENDRYQKVVDLSNAKQGPLDDKDLKWILGTSPVPYTRDDVIERTMPKAAFSLLDQYASKIGDNHFWNEFKNEFDVAHQASLEADEEDVAWYLFAQKLRHNSLAEFSNQGLLGQALDVGKQFFPLHTELKFRNNVEGVGALDGLLSSKNIENQRNALLAMPWKQRIEAALKIDKELKQGVFAAYPLASALFWEKILGQSYSDRISDDINTLGFPLDVLAVGQLAGKGYRFGRLLTTAARAKNDIKAALSNPDVTRADILAATGDIGKAGVEMAAAKVEKELIKGDVATTATGLDELPRFLRTDAENIRASEAIAEPLKNMILEQYRYTEAAAMKAISTMIRPAFPLSKATREVFDGIKELTKKRYPSLSDNVFHIEDPKYVPLSNTATVTMRIGPSAGKLFDDEIQAVNFARNKGLHVTLDEMQLTKFDDRIKELEAHVNVRKTAPIEKFRQEAQSVEASLPPVPKGHTRLYRGNRPGEEGSNPVYTNSLDGIALPFREAYGGKLTYIDVPEKTAQKYLRKSGGAPNSEFDLPSSLAKKAQVVNYKRNARLMSDEGGLRMDAGVEDLNKYFDVAAELKQLKQFRANLAKPGGYRIGQTGGGFHIDVTANLKMTDKLVRDFASTPKEIYDPKTDTWSPNPNYREDSRLRDIGKFTRWIGGDWWRTAEDTFGAEGRAARKASTYGQAVLYNLVKDEAKYLKDLARGVVRYDPVTGEKINWFKSFTRFSPESIRTPGLRGIFNKDEWQTFNEVLEYSQKSLDKDGVPGVYFDTPDQLNYHYMHVYDRLPSPAETMAYFAVRRWDELDRIFRELSVYSKLARLGAETHSIKLVVNGQTMMSPEFAGVSTPHLPKGRSSVAIVDRKNTSTKGLSSVKDEEDYKRMDAIVVGDTGDAEVKDLARLSPKQRDEFFQLMSKDGYKLIRIADPESRPLKGFVTKGEENIEYILAKNVETKPLSWHQVPRRGGGHLVYEADNFIKQPKIVSESGSGTLRHGYEGDSTWSAVPVRAMGEDVARRLSAFRRMLKDNKFDEAKKYAHTWFDEPYEDMRARFYPKKDEHGVIHPAQFSLDEDFLVVPRNRAIIDTEHGKRLVNRYQNGFDDVPKASFIDRTREGSLMRNIQVEYTGERDSRGLFTYENKGTVNNPAYRTVPAERLSPLDTLNRATSRIINSTFMDDYKIQAVENWIQEATPYLKVLGNKDELIKASPFFYFKHPQFISETPPGVYDKLMAAKYKIDQLVGTPTYGQVRAHSWSQDIADMVYSKLGPRVSLTPIWLLDRVSDGPSYFRSIAFHSQLGLFNPAQYFVQAMTLVNVFAHSPRYAIGSTWAAWLYQASRFTNNEKVIDFLDDMATKMKIPGFPSYKPGEFKEAKELFVSTGFRDVGGEYGPLDIMRQTKTISGAGGTFLNAGTLPMREGEKWGRIGAWFTAFKEFREKNPLTKIGNEEKAWLIDRADLLYNNMSVASHSWINNNALSVTTQFFTYAVRLGETFMTSSERLGKTRLDRSLVRARLLMTNMFMFGMPMAPGVTATPLGDTLRQMAVEHGFNGMLTRWSEDNPTGPYVADRERKGWKDWIDHFIMEGGPSSAIAYFTGEHTNFGTRMGSGGLTPMLDVVLGDSSFVQWLGGVSGQVHYETMFKNTQGLFEYIRYMFNKANGETYDHNAHYEPKLHDFTDLIKAVQTVSKAEGLYIALNTGKWVSKKHDIVKDISGLAAVMYTLTGVRPQQQDDARHMAVNLQDKIAFQKRGLDKLRSNLRDYVLASEAGNPELAQDYMRRGLTVIVGYDLSTDQIGNAISGYFKNNKYSLIKDVAFDRLITHGSKTDPVLKEKQEKAYRAIEDADTKNREQK